MAKITEKQKLFVDAYLADSDMNAARTYMQIYTSVKKNITAAVNASRLFAKPHDRSICGSGCGIGRAEQKLLRTGLLMRLQGSFRGYPITPILSNCAD